MNDVSPYVACNEVRGLLCAEKWKRLLENVLVCTLRYPGELEKKVKYCICYEIRVVCLQNTDRTRLTLQLICLMGHSMFEVFNVCNCIFWVFCFILRFNVLHRTASFSSAILKTRGNALFLTGLRQDSLAGSGKHGNETLGSISRGMSRSRRRLLAYQEPSPCR